VLAIKDIPPDFPLSARQQIQVACARRGRPRVDKPALSAFLEQLEHPLYFLDFETIATAIPLFDGVRPYQQVPFQYSVHVQKEPGGSTRHYSFLPRTARDPRARFFELLRRRFGKRGSIVAYNATFEKQRLQDGALWFPDLSAWVDDVTPRFVDLLRPFARFDCYYPRQRGSASLKAVLPALTGRSYDDLDIADGSAAGRAYLELIAAPRRQRAPLREQLERYCGRDTEGMVWIIDRLRELAG